MPSFFIALFGYGITHKMLVSIFLVGIKHQYEDCCGILKYLIYWYLAVGIIQSKYGTQEMVHAWTQCMIMVQMFMVTCLILCFCTFYIPFENPIILKYCIEIFNSFSLGLTCHPSYPFTMASCSRDSTVRLWSLTPLINPLHLCILADRSWDEIIGNIGG